MNRHRRDALRASLAAAMFLIVAAPAGLRGQEFAPGADDRWCDRDWSNDRERVCQVREVRLDARDEIRVDAGPNGGVDVEAWDRNEVFVRARVVAWADSHAEAASIMRDIRLDAGRTIRADGPRMHRDRSWSVSYQVFVPRETGLDLETTNGGLSVAGVSSRMRLRTVNGGIRLDAVGGDVRGRTTNGGLDVVLVGDRWAGSGLDLGTTNGGIRLEVPDGYSAELVTGTVNGRLQLDFPVLVQGRIDRTIETTLGDGGPMIRVQTTNGGVVIRRR